MNTITENGVVLLLSRTLSIYLFFWGCMELSYLPQHLYELSYFLQTTGSVILDPKSDPQQFFLHDHQTELFFLLVRVVILFVGSVILYRCGTSIRRLFGPGTDA
ncbi:hypothetical protein ACPPVV_04570 [Rhodanobacter sp. Col0626]|uniref:hypothetical protein n=1 Tax=Rhodanobacter sp. Col0626 TaxID=3415679 RepID=UPI003CE98CCC